MKHFVIGLFLGLIVSTVAMLLVSLLIAIVTTWTFDEITNGPVFWFFWAILMILCWIIYGVDVDEKARKANK
jgi:hypothetical protein